MQNEFKIIDSHVHLYPDFLAVKTYDTLSKVGGNIEDATAGTYENLSKMKKRCGINSVIVQHIATKPESVDDVTEFALSLKEHGIYSFAPLHPYEKNVFSRIPKLKGLGFLGVKIHPYFQRFDMEERTLYPFFEALENENLPLLIHAGKDHMYYGIDASNPKSIARIQKDFPSLKIIAAHMGGMLMNEEAQRYIIGTNVYIDTALSYRLVPVTLFAEMIKAHDPDRILFASDFPWSDPQKEIENIKALDVSQELKEKIFYRNAEKLYNI